MCEDVGGHRAAFISVSEYWGMSSKKGPHLSVRRGYFFSQAVTVRLASILLHVAFFQLFQTIEEPQSGAPIRGIGSRVRSTFCSSRQPSRSRRSLEMAKESCLHHLAIRAASVSAILIAYSSTACYRSSRKALATRRRSCRPCPAGEIPYRRACPPSYWPDSTSVL